MARRTLPSPSSATAAWRCSSRSPPGLMLLGAAACKAEMPSHRLTQDFRFVPKTRHLRVTEYAQGAFTPGCPRQAYKKPCERRHLKMKQIQGQNCLRCAY